MATTKTLDFVDRGRGQVPTGAPSGQAGALPRTVTGDHHAQVTMHTEPLHAAKRAAETKAQAEADLAADTPSSPETPESKKASSRPPKT